MMFNPQGSIVLKALIHTLSLFFRLFYLISIPLAGLGHQVFLLIVPIQACLDPVGLSFAERFLHVGTESIV